MNMAAFATKPKAKPELFAYKMPKNPPTAVMTVNIQGFFKNN